MVQKSLVIIALDGVPFSLLQHVVASGNMPFFKSLLKGSHFQPINSVYPPISSVAWASFLTGKSPAEHGISGFLEREPDSLQWFIPNASHLRTKTILHELSEADYRVFSMNVPITYPPFSVNGIIISGFLAPDIRKATYPQGLSMFLKAKGYSIDADVEKGKKDLNAFYQELKNVLDKRFEIMHYFFERDHWHFFLSHLMETDRLHHFFWKYFEQKIEPFASLFNEFYAHLDRQLQNFFKKVPDKSAIILLSDHGFSQLKYEVYLNRWLVENGYLYFKQVPPQNLTDMHEFSRAFSLYPGRIYVNLKGREKYGKINPGVEYEKFCNELSRNLLQIKDPHGQLVIKRVERGYKLYGLAPEKQSHLFIDPLKLKNIPDLVAVPFEGYDLKGNLWSEQIFKNTQFTGTHTFNDAFLVAKNLQINEKINSIQDVYFLIKQYFKVSV